ncbi:DUF4349 domain-containing protein [Ilumatobacter sp.]|uniref:DUF4349 domain-containing protein n=1 Tax=Ilumatobacter sp. TaxID=1967498 RepID=UPI003AF9D609
MGSINGITHTIDPASTGRSRRRRSGRAAFALAGTLLLAACGGDDDDSAASAEPAATEQLGGTAGPADGDFLATDDAAEATSESAVEAGGAASEVSPDFDIGVIGRDVIVEMRVVLSSDDVQRTVAAVMASASTLGGGVASSDVNYGEPGQFGSDGFAVLVVKVPPESIDRLLDGLDDTAEIQSINQSAQDVTEQLVDLDVRIRNARQSVDNVREFMERTENLDELVRLEAELTRRQTDLEQLEAQQRNLADRVALSTVTIEVIPSAAVPDPAVEDDEGIGDAFRSGWDAFTALLFGLGFVIAATLPFIVSGLLLALVIWLVVRRRDARAAPTAAMPAPTTGVPGHDTVASDRSEREPEPTH